MSKPSSITVRRRNLPRMAKGVLPSPEQAIRADPEVAYIVHFADCGQDFLRWEVSFSGYVLQAQPFQTFVWRGVRLIEKPKPGDFVTYRRYGESDPKTIRYAVTMVEAAAVGAAKQAPAG